VKLSDQEKTDLHKSAAAVDGYDEGAGVSRILAFWRSTLGKKVVMGITGLIMIVWLVLHMAGNLQAFAGAEKLNGYAALLHGPAH
jgi:hypothetical protein